MSIESEPRRQHHEDDERRDDTAPDMPGTPDYDTPPRPDHAPTLSGHFDTENTADGGWLRSGRARLLASVAAGSVLAGSIFIGVGLSDKEGKEAPRQEPGASAPVTPGETSAETDFSTKAEYYQNVYETDLFKELTPEQQHEVTKLEEMSYDVFRKLPYDRQLAYGDFYYRAFEEYGREQVERSIYYQKDTPKETTRESSGQDILNDFAARQGTIFYSLAEEGDPYNIALDDPRREEAQKALSYIYTPGDSNIYKSRVDQLANLENLEADQTNHYNGDGYPVREAVRESSTGELFGETVKYINVKDSRGGNGQRIEYDQYVYVFRSYTDIQGNERSVWQLSKILGEEHSQYQPDVESMFK